MTKRLGLTFVAACLVVLALAPIARAEFGVRHFDVVLTKDASGNYATQAGSHPFALDTVVATNLKEGLPEGWPEDLFIEQMPGLVGDTTAYKRCSSLDFLQLENGINDCPLESTVGINAASVFGGWFSAPVFNLEPPPGVLLRLGFLAVAQNIIVDVSLSPDPPFNPVAAARGIPQLARLFVNRVQLWGDPAADVHDELRGICGFRVESGIPVDDPDAFKFESKTGKKCPVDDNPKPFLTMPTTCAEPLLTSYEAFAWARPFRNESGVIVDDGVDAGGVRNHDAAGNPKAFTGCDALPIFNPSIAAQPTNRAAESPTGLDFALEIDDEGLISTEEGARAKSHIRKAVVTLPEGMTANPSIAAGLEVCSEQDLEDETLTAAPGEGCPQASKIGTLEVDSPLVDKTVHGALFQATPYANLAGDSLLAFYIVFKDAQLGINIKQPVRVEPDPRTGQLKAFTEEIPQLPFSSFRLHFREGGRSPLVSPPTCGRHTVNAVMTPWSGGAPFETSSSFEIVAGPNGGPCPSGGQPFQPGFEAGTQNNAAAQHSNFLMRLTRRDGNQDLVRFDATLPPGVVAKLAGVSKCSDAQIARADAKTGRAELASPSCPANSRIGSVQAGAGVGSQLTYVPGSVYLAGPFAGAPLSVVAVVPAVAGPFDVGTVVTRQALVVDPVTAEVKADGSKSEPIPHILAGIPLRVRDIQVRIDRPQFTLNPTSCDPAATVADIWGGGQDVFAAFDDSPVGRSARFQAADCGRLDFAPRLGLRLRGGTSRGDFPALRAVFRPRSGEANLSRMALRFPRSAFIEQGHFRTICTRVQYAADACPAGSIYGRARAFTPLLDQPLEGPVYLRSSDNNLPDAIFALKGLVDVEVAVRIDSVRGGLRATVASAPDVPVSRVIVNMQGGQKGLFVNSRNLCQGKNRAEARLIAHNGKRAVLRPVVRAQCGKKSKAR